MSFLAGLISAYECEEAFAVSALADSHSSNNLFAINTPAVSGSGLINRCRVLSKGSNEYFTVPDTTTFIPDVLTISLAVYPTSYSDIGNVIASKSAGDSSTSWRFYCLAGTIYFTARNAADTTTYTASTTAPSLNTWSIVEGGYDSLNQTIWIAVNGTITEATGPSGINSTSQPFRIGWYNSIAFDQFDGGVDQIYVWSRRLEDYERTWLYNSGAYRSYNELDSIRFTSGGIEAAGLSNSVKVIPVTASGGTEAAGQSTAQAVYNPDSDSPLRDSLIAAYEFEETSGDLLDVHINGYDLGPINSPGTDTGLLGNARTFNQVDNSYFIRSDGNAYFAPKGALHIVCAVYPTSTTGYNFITAKSAGSSSTISWRFYCYNDRLYFTVRDHVNTVTKVNSIPAPDLNQWSIVEAGYDTETELVWIGINGNVTEFAGIAIINQTNQGLYIGRGSASIFLAWQGKIDQCYYFNRRLTEAESAWLYNSGSYRTYEDLYQPAKLAGLQTNQLSFNPDTSGGVESAGQQANQLSFNPAAAGGVEAAGLNQNTTFVIVVPAGGVEAAGESQNTTFVIVVPAGGVEAAGESQNTTFVILVPAGGAEAAGQQANQLSFNPAASGGVEAAGLSLASRLLTALASGGVEAAGQQANQLSFNPDTSGGAEAAGLSLASRLLTALAAGGVEAAGLQANQLSFNPSASGGSEVSGTNKNTIFVILNTSGGVVAAGENINSTIANLLLSGGLLTGGLSMPQQVEKLIDESFRKYLLDNYPDWKVQQNFNIQSTVEPRIFFQRSGQTTQLLLNSVGLVTTTFDVEIITDDIDEGQNFAQDMKIVLCNYSGTFGYHNVLLVEVTDHDDDYLFKSVGDGDEGKFIAGLTVSIIHTHN